jgi:hypothetical protein
LRASTDFPYSFKGRKLQQIISRTSSRTKGDEGEPTEYTFIVFDFNSTFPDSVLVILRTRTFRLIVPKALKTASITSGLENGIPLKAFQV